MAPWYSDPPPESRRHSIQRLPLEKPGDGTHMHVIPVFTFRGFGYK